MANAPAHPTTLVELLVVDVEMDDARGPRVILMQRQGRGARAPLGSRDRAGRGRVRIALAIGIVDATLLSCLLSGTRLERPSWHSLYVTSVVSAGMEIAAVELELRPDAAAVVYLRPLTAAGEGVRKRRPAENVPPSITDGLPGGATVAVAAPVDAALLIAIEVGAPIYATTEVLRALGQPGELAAPGAYPAPSSATGHSDRALLAELLEHLPDDEFGKWKQ